MNWAKSGFRFWRYLRSLTFLVHSPNIYAESHESYRDLNRYMCLIVIADSGFSVNEHFQKTVEA